LDFNNYSDLALNQNYGAMMGNTHDEIMKYYPDKIEAAAKNTIVG
jgi:hypothetical protein